MKKILEDVKKVFESQTSFRILFVIGVLIVTLIIFSAGVAVGFHKASYGQAWGQHYNENFGMGPKFAVVGGTMMNNVMGYFPNAHGANGKIIKIQLPNIIVEDRDNTEKTILLSDSTQIEEARMAITTTDLKIDDFVVVIGTPNSSGVIEAKFIRVIPDPESLER